MPPTDALDTDAMALWQLHADSMEVRAAREVVSLGGHMGESFHLIHFTCGDADGERSIETYIPTWK